MKIEQYDVLSPESGETRMCLDPWANVVIKANGDVYFCCYHAALGNLSETPLDDIINSVDAMLCRHELLTGDLNLICQYCEKQICSTIELQAKVEDWYINGTMTVALDHIEQD